MRNLIFVFFLFLTSLSYSQISAPTIDLYMGGSAGVGDKKPFWNISDQYGRYTTEPFAGQAGIAFESIDSSASYISFNYGAEAYSRFQSDNAIILPEAYLKVRIPFLELWAGRKEEIIGNQDSLLSIGSTVWSMNAIPMPKVVLGTPGYVDVPFTKGYVEVNGSIGHGWFERDRYVEHVFLHQKQLHLRFGGDFFINASLGLLHFAQWGGDHPVLGDLPSDFKAYGKVFFAQGAEHGVPEAGERINRLGNHLGSLNYRIDIKKERFNIGLYYQTLFEDESGITKSFFKDGLSGLSLSFKEHSLINRIVIEFLYTNDQSGPTHLLTDSISLYGNDDYFNNYVYLSGWSYKGMILGTPLITSPVYYPDSLSGTINNRVTAGHIGIGGAIKKVEYKSYFTYSINRGTYDTPIDPPKNQFSWFLETTFPSLWQGIDLNVQLAADIGKMYGNNLGINFLFRKTFSPFP